MSSSKMKGDQEEDGTRFLPEAFSVSVSDSRYALCLSSYRCRDFPRPTTLSQFNLFLSHQNQMTTDKLVDVFIR